MCQPQGLKLLKFVRVNLSSLLRILIWRKKKEIDDAELMELYRSWLESKSVFDLQTTKQFEIYPKH